MSKTDSGALEKVTDYVEEKELSDKQIQNAANELAKTKQRTAPVIKIQAKDIDVLAKEFEMDKKDAENLLIKHGGDLSKALAAYTYD
mmetsp:Transcript_50794/g.58421  ORF Transcript_50794/g.58421 Transcript_50794/m.58421 type:complete len:87 (-) Transcript_50794:134-394(-)